MTAGVFVSQRTSPAAGPAPARRSAGKVAGSPDERLKIALMAHHFPVMSETFVINQACGALERGHDLTILVPYASKPAPGKGMHEDVERFQLLQHAHYAAAGDAFLQPIEKGGLKGLAARAAASVNEALLFAPQGRFDIVHCQFATLGLLAMKHRRARTLRTRRLVTHLRGADVTTFVRKHGEDVYRELFAEGDLFIANCDHFRNRAIELGCPPEKVITIGSSLRTENFPLKERYEPQGRLRLVTVGRLTGKKGIADILDGLSEVSREGISFRFDIVGDGPLRPELEAQAKRLGIADDVTFHGALNHAAIAERLQSADIFLAASVTSTDGDQDAPVNSLKEAMATGLPVIATRHGGIPELVIDGENGLLVSERAPREIADAVLHLSADPDSWARMGRAGRARTIELYDHESITDRLMSAYTSLLKEG